MIIAALYCIVSKMTTIWDSRSLKWYCFDLFHIKKCLIYHQNICSVDITCNLTSRNLPCFNFVNSTVNCKQIALTGSLNKLARKHYSHANSYYTLDWNHYFGLGPILKPKHKLAHAFGWYHKWYCNQITKGKFSHP